MKPYDLNINPSPHPVNLFVSPADQKTDLTKKFNNDIYSKNLWL